MKTYEVTLARLASITGSVLVEADNWEDAFAIAKSVGEFEWTSNSARYSNGKFHAIR
jgi:hypothetical protein